MPPVDTLFEHPDRGFRRRIDAVKLEDAHTQHRIGKHYLSRNTKTRIEERLIRQKTIFNPNSAADELRRWKRPLMVGGNDI